MNMRLAFILLFFLFFLYFVPLTLAHPGNTSSDGCHYCWTNCARWGYTYGTRHSHGGNTCNCNGPVDPIYCRPPQPTPIVIPTNLNGRWTFSYNDKTQSYDVFFDWDDWNQSAGWSVGLSQYAGADPGPNIDTTSSYWTFRNAYPGRKYINMKASVDGYWSGVSYWTIEIPPLPTTTPIPTNTPTPTITPTLKPTEIVKNKTVDNVKKTVKKKTFWQWLFNIK